MSEKAVRLTGLTRDLTVLEKGTSKTVTSNTVSITVAVSVKKAVILILTEMHTHRENVN